MDNENESTRVSRLKQDGVEEESIIHAVDKVNTEEDRSAAHMSLEEKAESPPILAPGDMKSVEMCLETSLTVSPNRGMYDEDVEHQQIKHADTQDELKDTPQTNITVVEGTDTEIQESPVQPYSSKPTPEPAPQLISPNTCPDIDTSFLERVGSIREKFELSAHDSGSNEFAFGESFLQKQRAHKLDQSRKLKQARDSIHGFDDMMIHQGKSPESIIDKSPMQKTFAFEGSMPTDARSNDGACRDQFLDVEYKTGIFVVHRARGMLLLKSHSALNPSRISGIPGDTIDRGLFVKAGAQSGHRKMQLQLAAREGAATHLFEQTGIDARHDLARLQPAVLHVDPPVDALTRMKLLKNEFDRCLYYFFQVSEEEFLHERPGNTPATRLVAPEGDEGSMLKPSLPIDFSGFLFLKEPMEAIEILQTEGNDETREALTMIMQAAAVAPKPDDDDHYTNEENLNQTTIGKGRDRNQVNRQAMLEGTKRKFPNMAVINCCCGWRKR